MLLVVLRCTDPLQSGHYSQQGGVTGLLPSHISESKVPHLMLCRPSVCGLVRYCLHHRNNLSMYPSTLLLESDDIRRSLHPLRPVLDLVCHYQYCHRFLHLVLADAIAVSPFAVEEEQVGNNGMFRVGRLVSQSLGGRSLPPTSDKLISVCFTTIIRMTTLASSASGTDFTCKFSSWIHQVSLTPPPKY